MEKLTHFNENGRAMMVDVGTKEETRRVAIASGEIIVSEKVIECIKEGSNKKGDVLGVAQVGGIMGGKKTSELIPMCHNIFLTGINIEFEIIEHKIKVVAEAKTNGVTGVEMEALTAVSTALLTIYDMCKAIDKNMVIQNIQLEEKTGGKSGQYKRRRK